MSDKKKDSPKSGEKKKTANDKGTVGKMNNGKKEKKK